MKKSFIYSLSLLCLISYTSLHAKVVCPKTVSSDTLTKFIEDKNRNTVNYNGLALKFADTDIKQDSLRSAQNGNAKFIFRPMQDSITFKDDEILSRDYLLCTYEIRDKKGALKTTVKISVRSVNS